MAMKLFEAFGEIKLATAGVAAGLSGVRGMVTSALSGLSRLGGSLTSTLGLVGLGLTLRGMVTNALEGRDAARRLDHALQGVGASAGVTRERLREMQADIMNRTRFGDEEVSEAQTRLLQVDGMTAPLFERAMAAATDLAAFTRGELADSAMTLANAMHNPVMAMRQLRSSGVRFSEEQRNAIEIFAEQGETLAAQSIIFEQIERQYGGFAETVMTPWDKLKNMFGELLETLGTAFLPMLEKGVSWLSDMIESFTEMADGPIGDFFEGLGDTVGEVFSLFSEVAGFVSDIFGPALSTLGDILSTIVDAIKTFIGWIRDAIRAVRDWIRQIRGIGDAIPDSTGVAGAAAAVTAAGGRRGAAAAGAEEREAAGERRRELLGIREAIAGARTITPELLRGLRSRALSLGDTAEGRAANRLIDDAETRQEQPDRTITEVKAAFTGLTEMWKKTQEQQTLVKLETLQQRAVSLQEQVVNRSDMQLDVLRDINAGVRTPRPAVVG